MVVKTDFEETGETQLLIDKSKALTCCGCGQVGVLVDAGLRGRTGFFRHGLRDGRAVTACCRCQQIQPVSYLAGGETGAYGGGRAAPG